MDRINCMLLVLGPILQQNVLTCLKSKLKKVIGWDLPLSPFGSKVRGLMMFAKDSWSKDRRFDLGRGHFAKPKKNVFDFYFISSPVCKKGAYWTLLYIGFKSKFKKGKKGFLKNRKILAPLLYRWPPWTDGNSLLTALYTAVNMVPVGSWPRATGRRGSPGKVLAQITCGFTKWCRPQFVQFRGTPPRPGAPST